MKHQKVLYAFITISSFLAPLAASAAVTICGLFGVLKGVKDIIVGVVAVFAVISILYSAFLFLTGGGDEEKQKKAKAFLIYGLIGIAVALFAFVAIDSVGRLIPGLSATAGLSQECGPSGATL